MNEPFYIGYLPQAPAALRRWLRALVLWFLALAAGAACWLAWGFERLPLSAFDYGHEHVYTGLIQVQPYPSLLVQREARLEQYLLVGNGKQAAQVSAYAGQLVRLRGTLITRAGLRMLEITPAALEPLSASATTGLSNATLGQFTLVGEIVDSKCYLGVMNPGHTKPHRACAARCISGGVPPLFLARDTHGQEIALQLADAAGAPLSHRILAYVAEPLEITGQVWRTGEWLTLRADPRTYRRR